MNSVLVTILNNEKKVSFDIIHETSENVTLAQLTDTVGNVNHAEIMVGYWIFDSKYKNALTLTLE